MNKNRTKPQEPAHEAGRTWLTLAARGFSVVLMISAVFAFGTAVISFFTLGPESGAVGVVMVDALFGAFILFIASRFLWIYAVKKERGAGAEPATPDS